MLRLGRRLRPDPLSELRVEMPTWLERFAWLLKMMGLVWLRMRAGHGLWHVEREVDVIGIPALTTAE